MWRVSLPGILPEYLRRENGELAEGAKETEVEPSQTAPAQTPSEEMAATSGGRPLPSSSSKAWLPKETAVHDGRGPSRRQSVPFEVEKGRCIKAGSI